MAALADHLASNGVDLATAKGVVAGHSRGAAVVNLIGAALDKPPAGAPFAAVGAIRGQTLHATSRNRPLTRATRGQTLHATCLGADRSPCDA